MEIYVGWIVLMVLGTLGTSVGSVTPRIALVIIDVQYCFVEGGTLPVADGKQVIPLINEIRRDYDQYFDLVVLSQDWHCSDHVSFYTQHTGSKPYDVVTLYYDDNGDLCQHEDLTSQHTVTCTGEGSPLNQTLWPPHCVINTTDAGIHDTLTTEDTDIIVRKGYHCQLDSYSVFFDNGGFGQTELQTILQEHDINTLYITGLARDYCVYFTAKDSQRLGYTTYVIEDATRAVAENTGLAAIEDMKARGIHVIQSSELDSLLFSSGTNIPVAKTLAWGSVIFILVLH